MQEYLTEDIPSIFGVIDGDGVIGHPPNPTQPFQVGLVNSLQKQGGGQVSNPSHSPVCSGHRSDGEIRFKNDTLKQPGR